MTRWARAGLATTLTVTMATISGGQEGRSATSDGRDALLAALGSLTIECLGTLGPSSYTTQSGVLARTFRACRSPESQALSNIDALLGVQMSPRGRVDDLAAHYTARWNAFLESFPYDRIQQCPTWKLLDVIDAPTVESIGRHIDQRRNPDVGSPPIGEQNARYRVSSAECGEDRECAVRHAAICARGFGNRFLVELDFQRARIEVDPAWWLTHYEYATDDQNPFKQPGYYHPMSYLRRSARIALRRRRAQRREVQRIRQWETLHGSFPSAHRLHRRRWLVPHDVLHGRAVHLPAADPVATISAALIGARSPDGRSFHPRRGDPISLFF